MIVALTRDSVAMGDDIDAPHAREIEIADGASLLDLVDAVLAAAYLASVMGGATWFVRRGGAAVVFTDQARTDRRMVLGDADRPLSPRDTIHFHYARQEPPERVAERLAA